MSMRRTAIAAALGTCLGLSLPLISLADPPASVPGAAPGAAPAVAPAAPQAIQPAEQAPYLGVMITSVPAALAAQLPETAPDGQGVMVRRVERGSPAEKAGMIPYDILLSYDDQKLFSPEQLTGLVGSDTPGRVVKLHLLRRGQPQDLSVALGSREKGWGEPLTMRDLHLSRHHPGTMMAPPADREQDRGVWREFDSLNLQRLGEGRYKASVDYLNAKRQKQHLEFEGGRDEIRKQIKARTDIPVGERRQILQALNLDERPWPMFPPYPWRDFPAPGAWADDWPF